MKILFLGGAGDMAVTMLDLMKDEVEVKEVTICDLDGDKASAKAEEYGKKFKSKGLDVTDRAALIKAMKGNDVVISYVGPFYRFENPVADAAIDAGVHYISIADDYDAFLEVEKLEGKAKQKGIKVLSGFGNSPGLTQMLAKKGYLFLDKPEGISVNWAAGSNEAVGPANILHLFHLLSGKTLQWRDGHEEYVPCGKGKKVVEFPPPIGSLPVFYTGHAESVSLPRNLEGLKYASVHGGVKPVFDVMTVRLLANLGLTKTHRRRKILFAIVKPILPLFQSDKAPNKSVGRVEVWGEHKGKEKTVYYTYVGHIAFITSAPCLQAAVWLHKGKFDKLPGGVYAPERLLKDPEPFLAELRKRGVVMEYFE
ncbi:MAG: saccharopine dehydrogenase NADP-binding domain-containing protein [Deltaproteobacteria bacterium]|uniref:Saccharopine dehydrogenase NADP-binding domain-containing protein n=1 Tax=Candidatus Zymogenus saltonus TaxID=2844893 RepID=A0A9D8KBC5_9DELT|nr:saccharopine dehydrogenase NADP-binding domain-containing protein [Candidatus Zymogenus saltonus]